MAKDALKAAMPESFPPQHQEHQPGKETEMEPRPIYDDDAPGCGRLANKVAIITGGDSGIGRAVAVSFAKEGASVAIVYLDQQEDAEETAATISKYGGKSLLIRADVRQEANCANIAESTLKEFGHIDILVNNAAVQYPVETIEGISAEQLEQTFTTNIYAYFYLTKHVVPHLKEGASIINTTSITAFQGNELLIDYSSTKGAIVAFTRSLSQSLMKKGIRVNGVAPGPVWTPLIVSSFNEEQVAKFGKNVPMGRAAQPFEIAGCYVFLASKDAAFVTGQILHPNGGVPV
ncbi:SDR family oxidoreductase [uncultured Chitinophaga sp.]|jgi:Dehydrogenases with different specificities (related to short-chain alcohol dehydrogenases)|uniref:SDR family oxidoreductase n=1 Tax=uncultured Chitinophaga sp. TaxID=339340 RepID=UPI002601ABC2|nr:SDR family oxidoreductase [uncultured Chitinophaga sp.]